MRSVDSRPPAENRIDAELKRRLDPSPEAVRRVVKRSRSRHQHREAPRRRRWLLATTVATLLLVVAVGLFWPNVAQVDPVVDNPALSNESGELILSRNRGSNPVLFVPRAASTEPEVLTIRNIGSVITVASSTGGPRLLISKGES